MEDEDIKDGKERIKKEHKGFSPNQEDAADLDDTKLTSDGKVGGIFPLEKHIGRLTNQPFFLNTANA